MAVPAEPFTCCHYCELGAETKHRYLIRKRIGYGRRAAFIYACFPHCDQAERDARMSHSRR